MNSVHRAKMLRTTDFNIPHKTPAKSILDNSTGICCHTCCVGARLLDADYILFYFVKSLLCWFFAFSPLTLLVGRQEEHPARKEIWGDGGVGHWLIRMEWHPARWSVCLPLLISPCTIRSRSSLLAPSHPGGPGKQGHKTVVVVVVVVVMALTIVCAFWLCMHVVRQGKIKIILRSTWIWNRK